MSDGYSNQWVEWYYSPNCRIARIDSNVVSYLIYAAQAPDKYVGEYGYYDEGIDTSLTLEINALGGGELRASITTEPYPYKYALEEFPTKYQKESGWVAINPSLIGALKHRVFKAIVNLKM